MHEKTDHRSRRRAGGRSRPGRRGGWRGRASGVLAVPAGVLPAAARADASRIIADARGHLATVLEIGLWLLLAGGYVAAAYMIISGAIRIFQDREGGLARFGLGVVVAIVMVVLMSYFVTAGEAEIRKIKGP